MHPAAGEPPLTLYDPSGPYTDPARDDRHREGPGAAARRLGAGAAATSRRSRRAPVKPEDNGNARGQPSRARSSQPTASRSRAKAGAAVTQLEYARAGIITAGDGIRRHPREPAPRGRRGGDPRRRGLRRLDPRLRHPRVRPRRGGPRPGHHPGQHQPRRTRADGHRPQLPGQDQRQHRQLGGAVGGRGRGRQDGLGDPLGRRHHHGPLHRPQHPQHPRVDHPQLPDAARHRADLPGAGEGRRRRRGPDLGGVPRHPDRAGRAGGRLLHHPRRRAPALHPADRQAGHRHRLARRLDHGQVVPGPPPRELPLRALRGHLRDHARLRRVVLAGRRPAPRLASPTPTTPPSSPSWRPWAS